MSEMGVQNDPGINSRRMGPMGPMGLMGPMGCGGAGETNNGNNANNGKYGKSMEIPRRCVKNHRPCKTVEWSGRPECAAAVSKTVGLTSPTSPSRTGCLPRMRDARRVSRKNN